MKIQNQSSLQQLSNYQLGKQEMNEIVGGTIASIPSQAAQQSATLEDTASVTVTSVEMFYP